MKLSPFYDKFESSLKPRKYQLAGEYQELEDKITPNNFGMPGYRKPQETTISANRRSPRVPITDEQTERNRARAAVDLIYSEDGKETPRGIKVVRTIEDLQPIVKKALTYLLFPALSKTTPLITEALGSSLTSKLVYPAFDIVKNVGISMAKGEKDNIIKKVTTDRDIREFPKVEQSFENPQYQELFKKSLEVATHLNPITDLFSKQISKNIIDKMTPQQISDVTAGGVDLVGLIGMGTLANAASRAMKQVFQESVSKEGFNVAKERLMGIVQTQRPDWKVGKVEEVADTIMVKMQKTGEWPEEFVKSINKEAVKRHLKKTWIDPLLSERGELNLTVGQKIKDLAGKEGVIKSITTDKTGKSIYDVAMPGIQGLVKLGAEAINPVISEFQPAEGKLIKAYHGSPLADLGEISFGTGVRSNQFLGSSKEVKSGAVFFTPNKDVAQFFADNRVDFLKDKGINGKATIYERYLDIKNPLDLTGNDIKKTSEILEKSGIDLEGELLGIEGFGRDLETLITDNEVNPEELWKIVDNPKNVEKLKKLGIDGAIFKESGGRGISYAIFNPKQALSTPTAGELTLQPSAGGIVPAVSGQKPPIEPPKTAVSGEPEELPEPSEEEISEYEKAISSYLESEPEGDIYKIIKDEGGIAPYRKWLSGGLGEEYRINVPIYLRNNKGKKLDEMANDLSIRYPQLGIKNESDLLERLSLERHKIAKTIISKPKINDKITNKTLDIVKRLETKLSRSMPISKVKSIVRMATGQTNVKELVPESSALNSAFRKAQRYSKIAYKSGKQEQIKKYKNYENILSYAFNNRVNLSKRQISFLKNVFIGGKDIKSAQEILTKDEATYLKDMLSRVTPVRGGVSGQRPVIPTSKALVPSEWGKPFNDLTSFQAAPLSGLDPLRAGEIVDGKRFGIVSRMVRDAQLAEIQADTSYKKDLDELTKVSEGMQRKTMLRKMVKGITHKPFDTELVFKYIEGTLSPEEEKYITPVIKNTVEWGRKKYKELLAGVNQSRVLIGKSPIMERNNYVTHITELSLLDEFYQGMSNIPDESINIPSFSKSNSPFFKFALQRLGGKEFKTDFIEAYRDYARRAYAVIYNTPVLKQYRPLVDRLPHNAYKYFNQYMNEVMALKESEADKLIPKPLLRGISWLSKQMGKGSILGNVASVFNQLYTLPNIISSSGAKNIASAALKMHKPEWRAFTEKYSKTLQDRIFEIDFDPTTLSKTENVLGFLMTAYDREMVRLSFGAQFEKSLNQGKSFEQSILEADNIAFKTQSGFRKSQLPPAFRSKFASSILQFQNTVNNGLNYLKYDLGKEGDERTKWSTFKAGISWLATLLAMNAIYRQFGVTPAVEEWTDIFPLVSMAEYGEPVTYKIPFALTRMVVVKDPMEREKARRSLKNAAFLFLPGGNQIRKTLEGIYVASKGGKFDKRGKLLFRVRSGSEKVRSVIFGAYGSKSAREYLNKRFIKKTKKHNYKLAPGYK